MLYSINYLLITRTGHLDLQLGYSGTIPMLYSINYLLITRMGH